jgi:phospholipase A1
MSLILPISLFCVDELALESSRIVSSYNQGLDFFYKKEYKKAFPFILDEAKKDNKEAQYLLGVFYEKGYGVDKDRKKSTFWFKKSSSSFAYLTEEESKDNNFTFFENELTQNDQNGMQLFFSKIDKEDPVVKEELEKVVNRNFGLMPYHINYINPLSYSTQKYKRHYSQENTTNLPTEYDNNTEVEFQLSLQKVLSYDLLGLNEFISASYTQQVWWQTYSESAPFRETNYTPEVFLTIPSIQSIDKLLHLKMIQFGYRHQSNGRDGEASRSWNRIFLDSFWQFDKLFVKLEGWYRLPEQTKDDNPNIEDYWENGELQLKYLYGTNQFTLILRNNLKSSENKGAVQFDWTAPIHNSKHTYWYAKVFNGYGESLIDYDKSITKVSLGFAFYRSLF